MDQVYPPCSTYIFNSFTISPANFQCSFNTPCLFIVNFLIHNSTLFDNNFLSLAQLTSFNFFFLSSEVSCSVCVFLRKIIHLLPSLHCRKLHFCSLSSGPLSCVVILLFSPFIQEINICFKFCSCCSSCVCKVF